MYETISTFAILVFFEKCTCSQNLILSDETDAARIIVIDFGFAKRVLPAPGEFAVITRCAFFLSVNIKIIRLHRIIECD
jgi:hypothetical protein